MPEQPRTERLITELQQLRQLEASSSIFRFESHGDPPDRYTITFRGKGVYRQLSPKAEVQMMDEHRCEMRLPFSFPRRPPDIRWLTPVFHPNVSFAGVLRLRDLGLEWDASMRLETICLRLWDVARLAFMDLDRANNFAAKTWYLRNELHLPVDDRPLRDRPIAAGNVVRYQRRGKGPPPARHEESADVLFIGPDTPLPPRVTKNDNEDVFYIGDE